MARINLEDPIIERPQFKGAWKTGITTLPDAAGTLDLDMGPVVTITPTAARILTLPLVTADMRGATFILINNGAFALTVNNAGGTLVRAIPATVGVVTFIVCNGDTSPTGGWIGGL